MNIDFILNNEKVKNAHGFYLLNSGCDFTRFDKNPVLLHNHDQNKLLGRWINRRIEGPNLILTSEFDTDDPEAIKQSKKIEKGFLRGASPGIMILEVQEINDEAYVTKWELMEGSIVSVPSGSDSLAIYSNEGKLLSASEVKGYLNLFITPNNNLKMEKLQLFTTQLELKANASEADVLAAIQDIMSKNKQLAADLATKDQTITDLNNKLNLIQEQKIKDLIDKAVNDKKIDETLRATYTAFAKSDFAGCQKALEGIQGVDRVVGKLDSNQTAGIPEAEKNWSFSDYVKNDKAEQLKAENFERFKALYKQQYNRDYE